jgi:hypothetical protein
MPMYDFKTLSPVDFEVLSRDLLQEELALTLQSFTSGKDGGVDFRYSRDAVGDMIVQCKHYAESGYDALLHTLAKVELPKIRKLSPKRYLLTTSVPLTPKRKDDIRRSLSPYVTTSDDLYGKDDLNNLLGKFSAIERKTIKLWLFSLPLLEEVLHAGVRNISRSELQRIRERAKLYVQNESFDQAVGILETHNFCVIAGIPGIGKTLLAEMLVLHYSRIGYEIVKVTHDIAEAWDLNDAGPKRLFYYDDFLGQSSITEKLRKNEDQRLLDFVHAVRNTPHTKLIMTTREHILQQAYQEYERLNRSRFSDEKCIVDLTKYTRMNRARILYNHVYFSDLPSHYRAALLSDRTYLSIVDHRNYNPRIMQLLTENARLRNVAVTEYASFFLGSLDNPSLVWEQAFDRSLSQAGRNLLVVLATLPHECFTEDLEAAYHTYNLGYARAFGTAISPQDFRAALKELDGDFLRYDAQELGVVVRFTNPSAADFVRQHIAKSAAELKLLFESVRFYEQMTVIWSWSAIRQDIIGLITRDPVLYTEIARRLLTAEPSRIITVRRGRSERKEHWPCPLEERVAFFAEVALHSSSRLVAIVREGTSLADARISSDDFDRRGLAELVTALTRIGEPSQREWIDQKIPFYVDALIEGSRWSDDLQPVCALVKELPQLFDEPTVERVARAVETIARSTLSNSFQLNAETMREEAETLESLSEIVPADVAEEIDLLRERADEADEQVADDDDRIEYSSSSSSETDCDSDEEIDSLFSTLTLRT